MMLAALLGLGRFMADAAPRPDGARELRLSLVGEPPMGPEAARTGDASAQALAGLLWDGLTAAPDDAADQPGPAVATSWSADDNDRRWTFVLDGDRSFSNGLVVGAEDVVASLQRSMATGTGPAQRRLAQLLDGDPNEAITADGPSRVVVRLAEAHPSLPAVLARPEFGITPRRSTGQPDVASAREAMITSGPYRVAATSDTQWRLEQAPTGIGLERGAPQRVIVTWQPSDLAAGEAVLGGVGDWAPTTQGASQLTIADGTDAALTMGIHLNTRRSYFATAEQRRAVIDVIDAPALAAAGFGSSARSSTSLVPGDPGCACDSRPKDPDDPAITSPEGGLVVLAPESIAAQAMAKQLVTQLKAAGLDATARVVGPSDYAATLADGSFDLVIAGASALESSAPAVAAPLFASTGTLNYSGLADPAVDTLLVHAAVVTGTDLGPEAWARANDAIRDRAVVVPVVALDAAGATGSEVAGIGVRPDGSLDLSSFTPELG